MVAIIDYDAGNIRSVEKAVQFLVEKAVITRRARNRCAGSSHQYPSGSRGFRRCYGKASAVRP